MATRGEGRRLLVSFERASGGPATSAVARDAALGGLFIETSEPPAEGTLLMVEISGETPPLTLEARVISVQRAPQGVDRPAGMAVRFLDLPERMLAQLAYVLDRHRQPAHTRIGVGDENEALWASAGGRDDPAAVAIEDGDAPADVATPPLAPAEAPPAAEARTSADAPATAMAPAGDRAPSRVEAPEAAPPIAAGLVEPPSRRGRHPTPRMVRVGASQAPTFTGPPPPLYAHPPPYPSAPPPPLRSAPPYGPPGLDPRFPARGTPTKRSSTAVVVAIVAVIVALAGLAALAVVMARYAR